MRFSATQINEWLGYLTASLNRRSVKLLIGTILTVFVGLEISQAQNWVTYQNAASKGQNQNDYTPINYPVVAVAAKLIEVPYFANCNPSSFDPTICGSCVNGQCTNATVKGSTGFGTDVVESNTPTVGHKLVVVLPNGVVRDIFPVPGIHDQLVDDAIGKGSVVEPNNIHSVLEDGRYVTFSYFHDVSSTGIPKKGAASYKGADLYMMDLQPLKLNPDAPISQLSVRRLTTKVYSGGKQTTADKIKNAINPTLGANSLAHWGNVYMHAVDMMTASGPKLVFITDDTRVLNSNQSMTLPQDSGHNFVLKTADIDPVNWKMSNVKQFEYLTTTSIISPNILRNGIAASYQASTNSTLHWEIQSMDSEGIWKPLVGYGSTPALSHFGTLCVSNQNGNLRDKFGSVSYYHINNNGFGPIEFLDMADQGINVLVNKTLGSTPGKVWTQKGLLKVTVGVTEKDDPSAKKNGVFIGKFSTPRCGTQNELFSAYTPTGANFRLQDADYNHGVFRPYLVKSGLLPYDPTDPNDQNRHKIVARDISNIYGLVYPTPIIDLNTRIGQTTQEVTPTITDPSVTIQHGMPHSIIGTSALYNTDVTPIECRYNKKFDPDDNTLSSNFMVNQGIINSVAPLRFLPNQSQANWCNQPSPAQVFGVAIHLTSNKTDMTAGQHQGAGYQTDGNGNDSSLQQPTESKKLLGIYDATVLDGMIIPNTGGKADQSFKALIPANVPFDLCLLDRKYGLCAADVRSWHSMKPRETRADCGGCHNHKENQGIPFENSHADLNPPKDFTNGTPHIKYDARCAPYLAQSNQPTMNIPVFHNFDNPGVDDVYTGLVQNCGSCHGTGSGNPTFTFDTNDPLSAYNSVKKETPYNNSLGQMVGDEGALGSPLFWYARGERTDGRDNNYYLGLGRYFHNPSHPTLCDGTKSEAVTTWVYRLGQWLDNHMPRDVQGKTQTYHKDRYHPSVDGALTDDVSCTPNQLRVGFWDDSGSLSRLDIQLNGVTVATYDTGLNNGSKTVSLSSSSSDDLIKVVAVDAADNHQRYEKSIHELIVECQANNGTTPPASTPSPSPSASASPSPSPTPGEEYLGLGMNQDNFGPGDTIEFIVDSIDLDGEFVIAVTNRGVNPGTIIKIPGTAPPYYVVVLLNKSKVLKRTVERLNGHTITQNIIKIKLPKSAVPEGIYNAQAIFKSPNQKGFPIKSTIVEFVISKGDNITTNSFSDSLMAKIKSKVKFLNLSAFMGKKHKKKKK